MKRILLILAVAAVAVFANPGPAAADYPLDVPSAGSGAALLYGNGVTVPYRVDDGWPNLNNWHYQTNTDYCLMHYKSQTTRASAHIHICLYTRVAVSPLYQVQQGGTYFFDWRSESRVTADCYSSSNAAVTCQHVKVQYFVSDRGYGVVLWSECGDASGSPTCGSGGLDSGWHPAANDTLSVPYNQQITQCLQDGNYTEIIGSPIIWQYAGVPNHIDLTDPWFDQHFSGAGGTYAGPYTPRTPENRPCLTPPPVRR